MQSSSFGAVSFLQKSVCVCKTPIKAKAGVHKLARIKQEYSPQNIPGCGWNISFWNHCCITITAFQSTRTYACWFSQLYLLLPSLWGWLFFRNIQRIPYISVLFFYFFCQPAHQFCDLLGYFLPLCVHLPVFLRYLGKRPLVSALMVGWWFIIGAIIPGIPYPNWLSLASIKFFQVFVERLFYHFLQIHELLSRWGSLCTKYVSSLSIFTLRLSLRAPLLLSHCLGVHCSSPFP